MGAARAGFLAQSELMPIEATAVTVLPASSAASQNTGRRRAAGEPPLPPEGAGADPRDPVNREAMALADNPSLVPDAHVRRQVPRTERFCPTPGDPPLSSSIVTEQHQRVSAARRNDPIQDGSHVSQGTV
ncbi:hypothetical protein JCM9957A_36610 [Kineosporia succinea]